MHFDGPFASWNLFSAANLDHEKVVLLALGHQLC